LREDDASVGSRSPIATRVGEPNVDLAFRLIGAGRFPGPVGALAVQRAAGNGALSDLVGVRSTALQRADAAPATAPATPAAATSDPDVDKLDLQPVAKTIANTLKKDFPSITFTSGKRDESEKQASAMSKHLVTDRQWITKTYLDTVLAKKLQDWVDANPDKKTSEEITKGLAESMSGWTDKEKGRLSAHFTGEAFDVQPQTSGADKITAEMNTLATAAGGKFLDHEGDDLVWHVQARG